MDSPVGALRASVERLHTIASGLNDAQVASPSYCDEWSIAQVLSHLGSGAVILQRSLADVRAGTTTPEDFNPSVWDEWNAKPPRSQVDDALVADEAVTEAIEGVDESERARLVFQLGPMSLRFDDYVGLRLNEHAFHTWDIAAALDEKAQLSDDEAALVVDNLGRIVAFSGRPGGQERTIAIHTSGPDRDFALRFSAEGVELRPGEPGQTPDLDLPAEAFARLVYGRLDAAHTPAFTGDAALLDSLRTAFPGF
jgi:uncharacterized protein (TIGR03083 family)